MQRQLGGASLLGQLRQISQQRQSISPSAAAHLHKAIKVSQPALPTRFLHSSRPSNSLLSGSRGIRTTSLSPNASPLARLKVTNVNHSSKRSFSIPPKSFSNRFPVTSIIIRLGFSATLGLGLLLGIILAHDAFTYSERHVDRVPCNPLSLHPRRGGKKDLPILEINLDDEEDDEKRAMKGKPRLVIVGGGWGVSDVPSSDAPAGLGLPFACPPLCSQTSLIGWTRS